MRNKEKRCFNSSRWWWPRVPAAARRRASLRLWRVWSAWKRRSCVPEWTGACTFSVSSVSRNGRKSPTAAPYARCLHWSWIPMNRPVVVKKWWKGRESKLRLKPTYRQTSRVHKSPSSPTPVTFVGTRVATQTCSSVTTATTKSPTWDV